jgi:antirestriction protein ArdC
MREEKAPVAHPQWQELLETAVSTPGAVETAFRAFHGYSLGNQIAAFFQCVARGITPGPIATFPRWIELGRHVKRGEKAIVLCQPVTVKAKDSSSSSETSTTTEANSDSPEAVRTIFIWRPRWFVLAQTDGQEIDGATFAVPEWNKARALQELGIEEIPFAMFNGNIQGYAIGRKLAINPVAQNPLPTVFHELGHIVLGHTKDGHEISHGEELPREMREVEAEAVALLCLESLRLPGAEFCRGYIQGWNHSAKPIPEANCARIFKAADSILRAGQVATSSTESEAAA